jgi:hypothetical protein
MIIEITTIETIDLPDDMNETEAVEMVWEAVHSGDDGFIAEKSTSLETVSVAIKD